MSDFAFDFVRKTPLVFAPPLNCWLKLESLQATGSFKLRGAAVKLSRMANEERARGVIEWRRRGVNRNCECCDA